MFELDEAAVSAALRELASEDEAGLDRAVDGTAERAHGRPLIEVEAMLRARLRQEGLESGTNVRALAEQIVHSLSSAGSPT